MKRFLLVMVAIIGAGLVAESVLAQSAASPAEQAIRPLMARMGEAARARDVGAFMAFMLHGPGLVSAINGRVIRGWQALHTEQVKWWSRGQGNSKYSSGGAPEFMALGPDVEIVTLQMIAQYTQPDGKTVTSPFVVTDVWQHLPQGWRIVYSHESWAKPRPD